MPLDAEARLGSRKSHVGALYPCFVKGRRIGEFGE